MGAAIGGFIALAGYPDGDPIGPLFGVHRLSEPALQRAGDSGGAGSPRSHGRGRLHRSSAGGVVAALHEHGAARLHGQRAGAGGGREFSTRAWRRTGSTRRRATTTGWQSRRGTTRDWSQLCAAMGRGDLASDARFVDLAGRQANAAELDELIGAWTSERGARWRRSTCCRRSGRRRTQSATARPAQRTCSWRIAATSSSCRTRSTEKRRLRRRRAICRRTPASYRTSAPGFGRDNELVLKEILGYDDERIAQLAIADALT